MLCMGVTADDVEAAVPAEFEVEDIDTGFRVYDMEGNGGRISFGEDDGTQFAEVDSWKGTTERVYEGQETSTETMLGYEAFDEMFEGENTSDVARVNGILMEGLETASNTSDNALAAEALVESAEDAYEILEGEDKTPTDFKFKSKPSKALGNASITYGSSDRMGAEKIDLDMNSYDRDFATPASYIMGAVLLQDSNNKPEVSTGLAYKTGSRHHEEQKDQADMSLPEVATEETDYDFLN